MSQIHDNEDNLSDNPSDSSTSISDSIPTSTQTSSLDSPVIVPSAYSKILVPHDNTEMSDKALGHAIYLANATEAEINILFVMENINDISNSSLVASNYENKEVKTTTMSKKDNDEIQDQKAETSMENRIIGTDTKENKLETGPENIKNFKNENFDIENEDLETNVRITAHGEAKKMIEDKLNLCKNAGATGRVTFRLATGRSVDEEIINLANSGDADLIVMTSSTISSSIRSIGSTARKVIDSVNVPVFVIHR